MNLIDAKNRVEKELEKMTSHHDPIEPVIIDNETIETDSGWIFFYQDKKYLETGEIIHALAGNAPYIVNKHTGEIVETGTAKPIEEYVREYEKKLKHEKLCICKKITAENRFHIFSYNYYSMYFPPGKTRNPRSSF